MANDLTRTPWLIDTASASTVKSGLAYIKGFEWSGYAASTDTCVIEDDRGRAVETFHGRADLTPVQTQFSTPVWIRDLAVTTLSAGVLTVYT